MVASADATAATAIVMVLEPVRSAIQPTTMRPITLVACMVAKTSPATLSEWPSPTTT